MSQLSSLDKRRGEVSQLDSRQVELGEPQSTKRRERLQTMWNTEAGPIRSSDNQD